MEKLIKFLLLIFVIQINIFALTDVEVLNRAVESYKNNNFKEALEDFCILNDKYQSAELFFNIGNCYMKLGKTGFAIGAYYSALSRDPVNPDIKHNLTYAKSLTKNQLPDDTDINSLTDVFKNIINHFTLKTHQLILLILYFILVILIIYYWLIKNNISNNKTLILILFSLLIIESFITWTRYNDINIKKGIVTVSEISIKYGPNFNDTEAFVLYEGTKFSIYNTSDNWYQIRLIDGKTGWIHSENFTVIQ